MRRKDRQISTEEALQVLDRCSFVTLATMNPDGTPYCIPISVARDRDVLYLHCAHDGHKADNLRAQPRVCISCADEVSVVEERITMAYSSTVVFGTALEVTDNEEKSRALRLLCERFLTNLNGDVTDKIQAGLAKTAVWKVSVEDITGKSNRRKA